MVGKKTENILIHFKTKTMYPSKKLSTTIKLIIYLSIPFIIWGAAIAARY
jgi:hypothetical protein